MLRCGFARKWLGGILGVVAGIGAGTAAGSPYSLDGTWVDVDYWAGSGSNEAIVVVDWNNVNGPYATASHAWGYRWEGEKSLADAISGICSAGPLQITTSYGGGYISDAYYTNSAVDNDAHSTMDWSGWWWLGRTLDGGNQWTANAGSTIQENLVDNAIYALNNDGPTWMVGPVDWADPLWGASSITIPVPEPTMITLLLGGGLVGLMCRRGTKRV